MVGAMKRVFAILHEPAAYTIDRNKAVYDGLGVKYAYMYDNSLAKSEADVQIDPLCTLPFTKLVSRIHSIVKQNDVLIMNGYTGKVFIILFIINLFYRRVIGIDSDTALNIPHNPLKRSLKACYLNFIFRNRHIYGLAGGSKGHKELFRHYGMTENRIFLMPMMVDNEKFEFTASHCTDPFIFLYVGRLIEVKNLPVLFEAFAEAFGGRSGVELRIVGAGALEASFKERYKGIRNICFVGSKYGAQLQSEYHSASAFILPSEYEPWGLVVNEAMSAGLPVIVSDRVGAAEDLVAGHDTGFVFKYDDKADLIAKMRTLICNKEMYREYSRNAYNRMHSYWNYDLYEKCLTAFIKACPID